MEISTHRNRTKKIGRCSAQTCSGMRCKKRTTYSLETDRNDSEIRSNDSKTISYLCPIHRAKENDTCNICFEPIFKQLYVTKCNHKFHHGCIYPWLMRKNTCPTCRHVFTQRLWITIGMYRNCSRKFNKGLVSYFWVETDRFTNYSQLGDLFRKFIEEHPKDDTKAKQLTRQVFYVTVNSIGNDCCPVSFKYLPDYMLDQMVGTHKSVKMDMLVNMIKQIAS